MRAVIQTSFEGHEILTCIRIWPMVVLFMYTTLKTISYNRGYVDLHPLQHLFFFSFIFFVSFFDLSSLTKTLFLWTYLYSPPLQETLGLTQRSLLLVSCFPIVHFLKQHQTISTVFYAQDVSWWCTVLHLDMDIYTLHLIALLYWFCLFKSFPNPSFSFPNTS